MLEDIIISKVRIKLLTLFLTNPGKIFHVREITRRTDEEINAIRRELARMEKAGMVASEWRQNRRFYGFRKDYVLFAELCVLIVKSTGLGADIIKNRAKLGKIKYAFILGTFAKAGQGEPGDIDLLIAGNVVLPELTAIVKEEEVKRDKEINYSVMSEEEFLFRKRRRDPFLLGILAKPRVMLLGDEEEMVRAV